MAHFQRNGWLTFVRNKWHTLERNFHDWLNKFLQFIKEADETLLKKYTLIPNMNGDFVSLEDEDFAEGVGLTDYMIGVLNNLGEDLTPILLNNNITAITLPVKIDAKSIAEKINEQADGITKNRNLSVEKTIEILLPLLNTVPTNYLEYDGDFIFKQNQIHSFTKMLYANLEINENINNDIPEKAFQALHKWLIKKLMETVSEYENVESLPETIENKIDWINSFIAFVAKEVKEGDLDECAIIPNQKGDFCYKKSLSKDINIPEELKTEKAEKFGIKLKDSLLHKEIDTINITSEKNINSVIEVIKEIFKGNRYEDGDSDIDFAIYLLNFLPENTTSILFNSQKKLLDLVKKYDCETSKSNATTVIVCNNEELWQKANNVIIDNYIERIEQDENIEGLKTHLSEQTKKQYDNGDTIIFLNDLYDYLKLTNRNISGKIVPNQNGYFCSLEDDLYRDDNIPEELKEILCLVNAKEDFRDILAESSLSITPTHSKKIEDIAKLIDEAIKETFADSRNWGDEDFKKAVALLIEYFKKHKEDSKNYFSYSYNKRDSIELNVLLSEKDREIIQSYLKGELGLEQVKQKDNEIAQLKEENAKLKTKNEELEKLLAEKEQIEKEKIALEKKLKELEQNNPESTEIQIIQSQISKINNQINPIEDAIIAIESGYNNLSKIDQVETNREAKEIVKEHLEREGFEFTNGIDGYSTINGVMRDSIEYPLVVKSYKYKDVPLKIGANEWIQLMKPNSMFWVHFGNRRLGCLKLYDLLRKQDKLSLSFNTENLDFGNRLENFAELLLYFKDVHFDFNSIKPDNYSIADNLNDYRFAERKTEEDLTPDNNDLL